jgi:hypothetical protein
VKTLALVVALLASIQLSAGCKAKEHAPKKQKPVAGMTDVEIQRGEDACKAYVDKICACAQTKPELASGCQLAKAMPEAMQLSLAVAATPDSKPDIVEQSYDSAKKTIANCIQETAKLPTLGCN